MVKVKKPNDLIVNFECDYQDFRLSAISAHKDQKYGELPYAYHLAMVESLLCDFDFQEYEYRAAAWLHDVVEDTKVSVASITEVYNLKIARMVWACTGEGHNRKERAECIYKRLKEFPEAAPVKCADRYANMTFSCQTRNLGKLEMYLKEWDTFKANVMPLMLGLGDRRASYMWNVIDDYVAEAKKLYTKLKLLEDAVIKDGKKGDGSGTEAGDSGSV